MDDLAVTKIFTDIAGKYPSLYDLEKEMAKWPGATTDEGNVDHIFSGGVYIRQLIMPKDTLAIGKRHRYETCNMLLKGEVSVYMGGDMPPQRIKAPFQWTSLPMKKKLVYFHEDSIFCNLHPTKETDLVEIEKHFIIPEEEYLSLSFGNTKHIDQGEKQ